jgi:hypothetical protein
MDPSFHATKLKSGPQHCLKEAVVVVSSLVDAAACQIPAYVSRERSWRRETCLRRLLIPFLVLTTVLGKKVRTL